MALFALRSNGKKIETLEELRENFNTQDMLDNFKTRCLHRWLEINRLFNELAEIKQIQSGNPDEIVSSLLDILKISESTRAEILDKISSNQKRQELSQNYSAVYWTLKRTVRTVATNQLSRGSCGRVYHVANPDIFLYQSVQAGGNTRECCKKNRRTCR